MKPHEMKVLERAFEQEIKSALDGTPLCIQSIPKKLAQKLVDDGLMEAHTETFKGVKLEGHVLTHLGRMAYCMTCEEKPTP